MPLPPEPLALADNRDRILDTAGPLICKPGRTTNIFLNPSPGNKIKYSLELSRLQRSITTPQSVWLASERESPG